MSHLIDRHKTSKNMPTIEGIQYLRGIAALMVVVYHARLSVFGSSDWPAFGYAGVDIFFVISGFVMAHTTHHLNLNVSLKERAIQCYDFMHKRLTRIVPLYFLGLLWVSRRDLSKGIISNDLLKDFVFIPHPNSEHPGILAPTLIQGWTLNYEMFFYVIFGVSMLLGRFRTMIVLTCLLVLVSMGIFLKLPNSTFNPNSFIDIAFHFYTNDILLEFGFGILAQKVFMRWNDLGISRIALAIIAISGFILLALLANQSGIRGLVLGIPAFFIVLSVSMACKNSHQPLLKLLGDASYAIYLFHWASFGAVKPLTAYLNSSAGQPLTVATLMLASFTIALVSGVAIHLLIEKPLLQKLKTIRINKTLQAS